MSRLALLLLIPALASCASTTSRIEAPLSQEPTNQGRVGVLVMAHGGDESWNNTVDQAVAGLSTDVPVELAYGMANPYTLQRALDRLADRGVQRVALVRAFLSGQSFLDQTRWYLGLSERPPEQFVLMGPAAKDASARSPLHHGLVVRTHEAGVLDSDFAAAVMADRARELSRDPSGESVLLLAHGMGGDQENDRVLAAMARIAGEVARSGFSDVRSATLREDWDDARAVAEEEIREYVESRVTEGDRVLVLPVRLSGFGPYAEVLVGLEYERGRGFLPHPLIGDWIMTTANSVSCRAGWGPLADTCRSFVVEAAGS